MSNPHPGSYAVPCIFDPKRTLASPLTVSVPGSKSITNRAMLLALLADGVTTLEGCLFSDDSRHFLACVRDLGFPVCADEKTGTVSITGFGGRIPKKEASLYVGSAGTAARFLTALAGTSHGVYHLDASLQMRRRPMAPLLASLRELGAEIICEDREGFFPFTVKGHGFCRRNLTVNIEQSSQFLSALLIAAVCSNQDISIQTQGSHGMSYIAITTRMMEQFGIRIQTHDQGRSFLIPGGQSYQARHYQIEPDVSAACYFYAMAPLLGIPVLVENVHLSSMQGDIQFLQLLARMGCLLTETEKGILLEGSAGGVYDGITADLSACSDQAITLAALAPFANTPTVITGIGHIRYQESDRIAAIAAELTRMGVPCREEPDRITIWPKPPYAAAVQTYDDHRMAMGFSLTGLRASGIAIEDPGCCRKTFETYFDVLDDVVSRLPSKKPAL